MSFITSELGIASYFDNLGQLSKNEYFCFDKYNFDMSVLLLCLVCPKLCISKLLGLGPSLYSSKLDLNCKVYIILFWITFDSFTSYILFQKKLWVKFSIGMKPTYSNLNPLFRTVFKVRHLSLNAFRPLLDFFMMIDHFLLKTHCLKEES